MKYRTRKGYDKHISIHIMIESVANTKLALSGMRYSNAEAHIMVSIILSNMYSEMWFYIFLKFYRS